MNKPNLFIIGQQKSGTSALHNFLEQHPDIFMSRPKEPHFFCSDLHKGRSKVHFEFQNKKDYLKLFDSWKNEKIGGEGSTVYIYSKTSAKEIHVFNPNAKIILMLREPVSFLHSLHMQYVNETTENIEDFEEALEAEKDRKNGKRIPKRVRSPLCLLYSERIKYVEQIVRYLKFFPKKQIKIIIFDDFKKDNAKVYKEVLQFLGVDDKFKPNFKGVHESKVPKSNFLNKFFRNPSLKNIPKSILPARLYDKIQLKVQKMLMKEEKRVPLDPKLRMELMKKYKPEVVKLDKLLHRVGFLPKKRSLVREWGYVRI